MELSDADAGQWAVVSANMILDSRNCVRLMQYQNEPLRAGGMYALRLPGPIPPAGSASRRPVRSAYHAFFGLPGGSICALLSKITRDQPRRFRQVMAGTQAALEAAKKSPRIPPSRRKCHAGPLTAAGGRMTMLAASSLSFFDRIALLNPIGIQVVRQQENSQVREAHIAQCNERRTKIRAMPERTAAAINH